MSQGVEDMMQDALISLEDAIDDAENSAQSISQVIAFHPFIGLKRAEKLIRQAIDLMQDVIDNKHGEY